MAKAKKRTIVDEVAFDNDADDATNGIIPAKVECPNYVIEKAKSSRAECKRCDEKIMKDSVRVGIILEGDWGLFTRWQHLECTIFSKEIVGVEAIDGFRELDDNSKADVSQRLQDSKNEIDEDFIPVDPNEMVRKSWEKPCEPTSNLLIPLLPYQKEGLGWMLHQELTEVHGGILADEMGMGKTIQAISLILYNRPNMKDKEQIDQWNLADQQHEAGEASKKESTATLPAETKTSKSRKGKSSTASKGKMEIVAPSSLSTPRAGTLIVLPTVAIRQWQTEIARFTEAGSLTVQVYHGSDRNTDIQDLRKTDVVITSYKVLEIEYRKATAGLKVTCKLCGKKFYPEKLRVHRKFFCGETAQRSDAQMKTQKKNEKQSSSKVDEDEDNQEDEDEDEEDEVDKQKRMIKNMRNEGKQKSTTSKSTGKKTASSSSTTTKQIATMKPSKKKGKLSKSIATSDNEVEMEVEDSSGDDAPAKTDRKKAAAVKTAAAKKGIKKSTVNKGKKAKPSNSDDDSSDDSDYLSEDGGNLTSDDDEAAAAAVETLKKPAAKKRKVTKSSKPAVKEEEEGSEDEVDKQKRMIKKMKAGKEADKKSHSKLSSKSKNLNKKKEADPSSSEEAEDEGDSDSSQVERDIAEAIRKNAQAQRGVAPKQSILHLVSWFRIILDEAHMIKDRSTSTAKAVFNLKSLNKWCLTGTPLQNRVGELYSLIRFLRIDPHAFYYCKSKQCTCKSLHYRFTQGRCDDCAHSAMQHYCHFNKHILNPIKRCGYVGDGRKAMLKLKQQVLDEVLLRRTKTSRAEDIQLPGRVVRVRQERMDEKEEDFYQALYTQSQAQFNTYLVSGTVLNNYAHIFDILIRLRQAVDHPYLVIYSDTQSTSAESKAQFNNSGIGSSGNNKSSAGGDDKEEEEDDDAICSLCHEPTEDEVRAECGHRFCRSCLTDFMATIETPSPAAVASSEGSKVKSNSDKKTRKVVPDGLCCPDCKKPLTVDLLQQQGSNAEWGQNSLSVWDATKRRKKSILGKVNLANFQSSTKLEALMEELYKMEQADPGAKAIVFSQFVNMLDILEYRIQRGGVGCVKMLGHMNIQQRDNVIKSFKEDPDVKVFLISLKAGGVALNLTVASRIFIMDPWWNPAAEMQAIDRTHRIGQFKPIFATRFIIENSIEERILKLQEKKKLVFDGTVGGDSGSMSKLTVDDMRFLFQ